MYQVLGNLVQTYNLQERYLDDAHQWMGIPETASFKVQSTYRRTKGKSLSQRVFGRDMIPPINHVAD